MAKRYDEFVVGYRDSDAVYGAEGAGGPWTAYAFPVPAKEILDRRKALPSSAPKTIYRLVPVPVAEVERQAARERKARKGKR